MLNKFDIPTSLLPPRCQVLDFRKSSPDFIEMLPTNAGLMPDNCRPEDVADHSDSPRAGLFQDDMPQNIVTRVYNYHLSYVLLLGSEDEVYCDNLQRTLVPDIAPDIKILKV